MHMGLPARRTQPQEHFGQADHCLLNSGADTAAELAARWLHCHYICVRLGARANILAGHLQGQGVRGQAAGPDVRLFEDTHFPRAAAESARVDNENRVRFSSGHFLEEVLRSDARIQTNGANTVCDQVNQQTAGAVVAPLPVTHADNADSANEDLLKFSKQGVHCEGQTVSAV